MSLATTRYNGAVRRLILSLACLFAACSQAPVQDERPNVILVMTDDQGWAQVGFHGNPYIQTPTLDRLASESIELTQFYVEPKCAPTRAALLTGQHGYRNGVIDTYLARTFLDPSAVTLAEWLGDAGYETGIFGKWHLGDYYPMRPMDQGFQETLVHRGGGLGQSSGPPGNTYFDPLLLHNGEWKKHEGYCTRIFSDALIEFIEQNRDRPFFAYLPTNVPHGPFLVADEYVEPYRAMGLPDRTARVYGMITEFDENLKRVLGKLDELGLRDNTIVIFLTDNGPTQQTFTAGLREKKGSTYEGGTRVPFLIRWPARLGSNVRIDRITAHIDVVPTLLDAAGVTGGEFDGVSLLPLLSGQTSPEDWPDRTIYLQNHRGDVPQMNRNASARNQRWKLVQPLGKGTDPFPPDAEFELYDMSADPGETNNLADEHPDIVEEMREGYEAWFHDVSTRGFEPTRIVLGTSHEEVTTLSRYDWRGDGPERARPEGLGYWSVQVDDAGEFDLNLRFSKPLPSAGKARLRVGEVEVVHDVAQGAESERFESVSLAAGPAKLEALLEYDGQVRGAHFVDISRRR